MRRLVGRLVCGLVGRFGVAPFLRVRAAFARIVAATFFRVRMTTAIVFFSAIILVVCILGVVGILGVVVAAFGVVIVFVRIGFVMGPVVALCRVRFIIVPTFVTAPSVVFEEGARSRGPNEAGWGVGKGEGIGR